MKNSGLLHYDNNNQQDTLIVEVLNSLPYIAIIVNKSREILYANPVLLDSLHQLSIDEFIGKRPGEAFNCLHFNNSIEACGNTPQCKFCGTANVIIQSQLKKERVKQVSRITRTINGTEYSFEFEVTASPFKWLNRDYTLLTMLDISEQQRKKKLERIFFHDILNKSGTLLGFIELLQQKENLKDKDEILGIIESISDDLNDEIIYQKDLINAESGDLYIENNNGQSKIIITNIVSQLSNTEQFKHIHINLDDKCEDIAFTTDLTLLKRILINMLKNALEASPPNGTVKIGCNTYKTSLRFFVKNQAYIPEDIQLQIFQRSFSTKGPNRGLGTYSMKLLGERYLKGKVHFTSTEEDGTIFYFDLPLK